MDFIYMIVCLFLIIAIHELGHFLSAKALGFNIDLFVIGLGPAFCICKIKGTKFLIGCIPLGGYCIIPEIDTPEKFGLPLRLSAIKKMIIYLCGPLLTLFLSILLISVFSYSRSAFSVFEMSIIDLFSSYFEWIVNTIIGSDNIFPSQFDMREIYSLSSIHVFLFNMGHLSLALFYFNILPFMKNDGYSILESLYLAVVNRHPDKKTSGLLLGLGIILSAVIIFQ